MAKYTLQWKKGNTERYYVDGTGYEVQIGQYRGLDNYDKSTKTKPTWHNKWYVDDMHGNVKLFKTQSQAKIYLKKLLQKIYRTKQL